MAIRSQIPQMLEVFQFHLSLCGFLVLPIVCCEDMGWVVSKITPKAKNT